MKCFKYINLKFILLLSWSILNMLFTHYYSLMAIDFENRPGPGVFSNLFGCVLDVVIIYVFCWVLSFGRVKPSLFLTFIVTFLLSFSNVIYSRFFGTYLPKKALTQLVNLNDGYVIDSILSVFKPIDLFFVLSLFFFLLLYKKYNSIELKKYWFSSVALMLVVNVVLMAMGTFAMVVTGKNNNIKSAYVVMVPNDGEGKTKPTLYMFKSGFFRRFIFNIDAYISKPQKLTCKQILEIQEFCNKDSLRYTAREPIRDKNLIFILVESYLSATSDLKVDGKEITPFLNNLKRKSECFYNGNVHPNTKYGESSDGQLIYMTGLLPFQSDITVEVAKDCKLYGLPNLLKERGDIKESHIILPTASTFWLQDYMCKVYGINRIYSKADLGDMFKDSNASPDDAHILSFAAKTDASTPPMRFFSLILTLSMHGPYDKCVEHGFTLKDKSLPKQYKNYLVNCHYMDKQIEEYINELKKKGMYDNSVIVIASDHDAHPWALGMDGKISTNLPLYILNGEIDKKKAWQGECNQIDVYTTLADIFGLHEWRGLGYSLLRNDYVNSVTDKTIEISELIIRSNYFLNYKK